MSATRPIEPHEPRPGGLVAVTSPGDGLEGATLAPASASGSSGAYVRVLMAIALGVAFGAIAPDAAAGMKPLGDGFIRLVKMVIAPIIFTTVVHGIASMRDLRRLGRVGLKAIIYFEAVTTLALLIGLGVVHLVRPGEGLGAAPLDAKAVESYRAAAEAPSHGISQMLLEVIPESAVGAFAKGEVLPVLLLAILTGLALSARGDAAGPTLRAIDEVSRTLFALVGVIMKAAPIGAFGAMSYTVGKFGLGALASLAWLLGSFYVTAALFVLVVLGAILRLTGLSILRLLRHIGDELLLVLATSSSESALPQLMAKLQRMGCSAPVVGLVVPTGYSFNLDGTSIYLTMATVFVAQATATPLTWGDELSILGVLLLTSKGAAGVTGSGFVTLAGTLEATRKIPVAGLSLLLGIDRFMSEARAIVNLIGNAVATIVIAWWEGELDIRRARETLGMDEGGRDESAGPAA